MKFINFTRKLGHSFFFPAENVRLVLIHFAFTLFWTETSMLSGQSGPSGRQDHSEAGGRGTFKQGKAQGEELTILLKELETF